MCLYSINVPSAARMEIHLPLQCSNMITFFPPLKRHKGAKYRFT